MSCSGGVFLSDMQFISVLSGWEGSAAYSGVLCDAITRPNGLRVFTSENEILSFDMQLHLL